MTAAPDGWTGAFVVTADSPRVARFAAALGYDGTGVPPTWPVVWLAEAPIRAAIEAALPPGPPGRVPVHLEQRFDLLQPWQRDGAYALRLRVRPAADAATAVIEAEIDDSDGRLVCRSTARLALTGGGT